MDKNPLEITSTGVHSTTNKRGRPVNACSIQFSNPPRRSALIAQILKEKSLKKSTEQIRQSSEHSRGYSVQSTSEQCWARTASLDSDYEEEVKPVEVKVEVLCQTNPERPNIPREKKPKIPKEKKVKIRGEKKSKKCKPTQTFACDYPNCKYAARLACNLIKHKRIHTSEKPYICDQCPFRTNFVNSLKVHRRLHTEEKPYNCEVCGYRCNTSSNLKKHRMHRHPEVAKI